MPIRTVEKPFVAESKKYSQTKHVAYPVHWTCEEWSCFYKVILKPGINLSTFYFQRHAEDGEE